MTLTTGGRVQSVQSDNIRRLPGFCGSCRLRCWKTRSRRSCIMMNLRVIIRRAAKVTPYSHDGSRLHYAGCTPPGCMTQIPELRLPGATMKKNQKGFSLIELLIVVVIILIIAAIAIPNLLRARIAANESSAVGTLRSMNTANATYETLYDYSFANSLPTLGGATVAAGVVAPCTAANLIDNVLSATNTPSKSGYNFNYVGANPNVADALCNSDTTYTI